MADAPSYQQLQQQVKELEKTVVKQQIRLLQLEALVNSSLDMIGTGTLDGYFTQINSSFQHVLGYSDDDFLATPFISFIHPKDVEKTLAAVQRALDGKKKIFIENRYRCKDGSYKWIDWTVFAVAEKNQFFSVGRDVTARKQSEERFRLAAEVLSDLIYEWDLEDDSLLWFGDIDSQLGYLQGEFPRTIDAWISSISSEDMDRMNDSIEFHRVNTTPISCEYKIRRKDGSWRYWSDKAVPVLDEKDERPVKWVGVCKDISDSKFAEQALQESEEKYRDIFEKLVDVYFETTLDGTIVYSSPSGARLSGYDLSELIGNNVDMLYRNPQDRHAMLADLKQNGKVRGYELVFQKKNGDSFDVSVNADISFDDNGAPLGLNGTIRDITEEKRLKAQLQRSKKMESIGLMAGGIAHDLNNILSAIVGYPDLMLLDLPPDSPMRPQLKEMKDSGRRAAEVVADLLTVAKGVATGKSVLCLNTVMQEFFRSREYKKLKEDYPEIVFQSELDSELLNILCSAVHMKKVLMNLLLNAAEAINGRGRVVVKTSNCYLDEPLAGYENVRIGEYVLLTVSDTGTGIANNDIDMIFEPFFTKKVLGRKGTGLGLTVVWNTVQEHDGYINVINDEHTVFELYFPVNRSEVSLVKSNSLEIKRYSGNGQKILIVDDEKNQREITTKMLTCLGYDAVSVASGEEALQYLSRHRVDLVVLDMIMPMGMNGRETYEKAILIDSKLKAIIATGYADNHEVKAAQKLGAGKYVKKPFSLEKIGLAVTEELARA